MKHLKFILAGFMTLILFAGKANAQTATPAAGSFAGKWDVLIKGLPNGDTHMFFTITEQDGKLGGTFQDQETKKDVPLTKVEKDDKGIVVYFSTQGYDVNMTLQKKDDDHLAGSLMNMFECTGERVKAEAGK